MLPCRGPVTLAPGVMTTGEVPRVEAFETVEGFWTIRDGSTLRTPFLTINPLAMHLAWKGVDCDQRLCS